MTIIDEIRGDRRQSEALFREQLSRLDQRLDQVDRRLDRLETRMGALEVKVGDVKADLMKWSFVFWVGAVGAISALAGVLR